MLLVGTNVKYASSGNTLNAALTPDLLDNGSIGIYIVGSDGRLKLVVQSGTSGPPTGTVLASSVKSTDKITMFQGKGSGHQFTSETLQVRGLRSVVGSDYSAATPQTSYIGYNPITGQGDLNAVFLPSNIGATTNGLVFSDPDLLYRQEAEIQYRVRMPGNNEYGNFKFIQAKVVPTDTGLSVAQKLVAAANTVPPYPEGRQDFTASLVGAFLAAPVQSAASTATTGGTVPANTYYATIVYYGTNGNSLGSNERSVTTTGTTSTVTFNWSTPPTGTTSQRVFVSTQSGVYTSYYNVADGTTTTLTLTAIGAPIAGTVPTSDAVGIKLVEIAYTNIQPLYNDQSPYPLYTFSVFGVILNATITQGGPVAGSGNPWQIRGIEKDSLAYRGSLYTLSVLDRSLVSEVDFSATYQLYRIRTLNVTDSKTGAEALTDQMISTDVAFVVQGNTLGTNQRGDFESIMTSIFLGTVTI